MNSTINENTTSPDYRIINRYAADGRKLETEYFTMKLPLVTPIYKDTVYNWTYSSGLVDQTGIVYVENIEYKINDGNLIKAILLKAYNSEGYSDIVDGSWAFNYYRKDHLGNIREVWRASYLRGGATNIPAVTIQQTQYYPSGLPWSEGIGAVMQSRKYNGKEFVEMHGYDTYDYGARGYYAASGRFTSVDPLAEKYYSISPYAYCKGNPVRYIDVQGRFIVDPTGRDVVRIQNSMTATNAGRIQWNNLVNATYPVSFVLNKININITKDAKNIDQYKLGNTQNTINLKTGEVLKSDVTIYEATIDKFMQDTKNSKDPLAKSFQNNTINNDQVIGAVAGHESYHATDVENQKQKYDNTFNGASNDLEAAPTQIEMEILDQTGLNNLETLPNPLSTPIEIPQIEPINISK